MRCAALIVLALALATLVMGGCRDRAAARPGSREAILITLDRQSSSSTNTGSTSSTRDRDTLIERVVGVRSDGTELEYDLPPGATAQERAGQWQFPVRVFRPSSGPLQLLNAPELEARVDRWLAAVGKSRADCGSWGFTWTAFQIDCDPRSVIAMLEAFGAAQDDVRAGLSYRDPAALAAAPLTPKAGTLAAEMTLDPESVRREMAQTDVVVAMLMRKPTTLDAALEARRKDDVSGTISIDFALDTGGKVERRRKVTRVQIRHPGGEVETRTTTETLERRAVRGG